MNYYEIVNVKAEQTHDWLQEAEMDRLLRQSGIDQRVGSESRPIRGYAVWARSWWPWKPPDMP